ncbi:MAG: tryptophan synthase subunit alpha [Thermoguttaceae bacterium]
MCRINNVFQQLKQENRAALIGYITAGDPDFDASLQILDTACKSGLDILELGIPFSDPTADGPVIQRASSRAIRSGMTLEKGIEMVRFLRNRHELPIILFSYYNPILAFGPEKFVEAATDAGADGVLVVDLTHEDANELSQYVNDKKTFPIIKLVTPTTSQARRLDIVKHADGFVYVVSRQGVTGNKAKDSAIDWCYLREEISYMKKIVDIPFCIGFGISNSVDIRHAAEISDGVIIGSVLQQCVEDSIKTDNCNACEKIAQMIHEFSCSVKK